MSSEDRIFSHTEKHISILSADSAMVPGVVCQLTLRAEITARPSAAELALVSGLLPELLEQMLSDSDVEFER